MCASHPREGTHPRKQSASSARPWSTDQARVRQEHGVALIVALMSMLLLVALALSVTLTCVVESRIAASYAAGGEALYAAEAAAERVMADLSAIADWDRVLDGTVMADGTDVPTGTRELPDGSFVNVAQVTNELRCGRPTACSDADVADMTSDRPWGLNNPRWQVYAAAPLHRLLSTDITEPFAYVVVWAGDDSGESDGNPLDDENGTILLIAHAYGLGGVRRAIEVAVARALAPESEGGGPVGIRLLSWRQVH